VTDTDLATPSVSARTGLNQRSVLLLVSGFIAVVLAAVIALLPAPYAIYGPGPVTNVLGSVGTTRLISISGATTYQPEGQLDMTTVQVFGGPGRRLGLPDVLWSWVSRERAVVPEEQVFPPGQTQQQVKTENAAEMSGSQETATAAGLREAGLVVPESIAITEVSPTAPAASVLRAGDVVTGIDGRPTVDSTALRARIAELRAGQQVRVQIRRGGAATTVTTTTYAQDGRTVLGVGLDPTFRFPVDVDFAAGDVGGPSAGMMFALGIYDLITPGDLTGGRQIAGTGTIDAAGTVGPIGGIAQKLVGARSAGAAWFLAPADNCAEVVGNVPDGLRVVRTESLRQSRTSIAAIAAGRGDSLPTCGG
jgi:PDZ domain-containing protein